MSPQKRLQFRPFVSLLTTFSFIFLVVTGAVLYITPPGRVANWTNWTFWGLTKHQWGAMHICFASLFLTASVLHIWLNLKPLMNYFVRKTQAASKVQLEWILALAVCGLVFLGSLKPFVPFSSLLNLNERLKNSWDVPKERPPVPHAESLTIEELAKGADIEVDTILQNLNAIGIEASASDVFGTIAEQQNVSPNKLFTLATSGQKVRSDGEYRGSGGGFGQKTLRQACQELGIAPEDALKILKDAGVEASLDERIRAIADENNIHPQQVHQLLKR